MGKGASDGCDEDIGSVGCHPKEQDADVRQLVSEHQGAEICIAGDHHAASEDGMRQDCGVCAAAGESRCGFLYRHRIVSD